MARLIDERLLPTFLPASPVVEKEPTREELMKNLVQTQQSLEHNLKRLEASLSRRSTSQHKKGRHGVYTSEASKSLHDVFGLECSESTITVQPTSESRKTKNQLRREQRCFTCPESWTPSHICGDSKEESLYASIDEEHMTLHDGYKIEEESPIGATDEEHMKTEEDTALDIIKPTMRANLEACDWETHIESTLDGKHASGNEDCMGVEHEEHSDLLALAERSDPEVFDSAPILHYRDRELPLLESPLKAQVRATCDIVEHIPCGSTNKEVCASLDGGDMYITDEDTPIWDPEPVDTSGVIDTVAHTGHRMMQGDPTVCSGMQWYAGVYSGTQWSTVELGEESYSHLIVQGDSRGDRSTLLQ